MLPPVAAITKTDRKPGSHTKLDLVRMLCVLGPRCFCLVLSLAFRLTTYYFSDHLENLTLPLPVLYEERYNDLEKYLCSVRQGDVCFGHFHPCAALTTDHVSNILCHSCCK